VHPWLATEGHHLYTRWCSAAAAHLPATRSKAGASRGGRRGSERGDLGWRHLLDHPRTPATDAVAGGDAGREAMGRWGDGDGEGGDGGRRPAWS
jgi:hypothetical protein